MNPSRNRKVWRLPVGDWVVVRAWEAGKEEERYPFPLLGSQLRVWAKDAYYSRVLLDLCQTLWGGLDRGRGDRWIYLVPRLEDAFRRGTLVLVKQKKWAFVGTTGNGALSAPAESVKQRRSPDAGAAASGSSAGSGSTSAPRKPKTWVAIRLADQDGQPLSGEAYRLVLPDGTVQEGSLDETGEAFVNGIDPGDCQISFPMLDAKEWKPA